MEGVVANTLLMKNNESVFIKRYDLFGGGLDLNLDGKIDVIEIESPFFTFNPNRNKYYPEGNGELFKKVNQEYKDLLEKTTLTFQLFL